MGYHLRYQESEWAMHHVVSRFINGFAFTIPTPEIVKICAGVLGRSLHLYSSQINLIHYSFLSNHFHLLLESKDVHSLAEFMKHFKSNLARELARIHDWKGSMWQSRYASEEILDEESFIEVFKYITENSVKEGLVDHPRDWKGLHGFHQLVDQKKLIGSWLDRTSLSKAKGKKATGKISNHDQVKIQDFMTDYEVQLKKPKIWAHLSTNEYHQVCSEMCNEAIKSARVKYSGHSMGMTQVLTQPVLKSRKSKRSKRPLCRAKTIDRFKIYQSKYWSFKRSFQAAYQYARSQVMAGMRLIEMLFPSGGITPMSISPMNMIGLDELPTPHQLE